MDAALTALVSEIEPEAVYQGSAYEQTVSIRLDDGQELQLFDGGTHAKDDMIGDRRSVVILALPRSGGIKRLEESVKGITSSPNPLSRWSYIFTGVVTDTDIDDSWSKKAYDRLVKLDIGSGYVLVPVQSQLREAIESGTIKRGDCVQIESSRTDLIEITRTKSK